MTSTALSSYSVERFVITLLLSLFYSLADGLQRLDLFIVSLWHPFVWCYSMYPPPPFFLQKTFFSCAQQTCEIYLKSLSSSSFVGFGCHNNTHLNLLFVDYRCVVQITHFKLFKWNISVVVNHKWYKCQLQLQLMAPALYPNRRQISLGAHNNRWRSFNISNKLIYSILL